MESCMSICEFTPMALSLLLIFPTLPLRVMACCMRCPWLSTELFRGRSFERPRYFDLGNRSVREKRFLLMRIVRSRLYWSSFSSSLLSSAGKNFLESACTIGKLRI